MPNGLLKRVYCGNMNTMMFDYRPIGKKKKEVKHKLFNKLDQAVVANCSEHSDLLKLYYTARDSGMLMNFQDEIEKSNQTNENKLKDLLKKDIFTH